MKLEKVNEVQMRVYGDMNELATLRQELSFFVPGAQYSPAFKNKVWNGKISYLDGKNRTVPIGLFDLVKTCCENWKLPLELDRVLEKDLAGDVKPELDLAALKLPFPPRDYQLEEFETAVMKRRGVVLSPTGSGKSLVIYLVLRWILENVDGAVLLVVPTVSLVEQMWSDFVSYGWDDIGDHVEQLYSGKKPTFKKRILLTTYQSIMRKDADFYWRYSALINDEAHTVKSTQLMKIAKFCVNARYRLGFTGTLPTEKIDLYNVQGMLGPKIYELRTKALMDRGLLSGIKVVNLFLSYPEPIRRRGGQRSYPEEVRLLEELPERNQAFSWILDNLPTTQNTLILVNHIEHLERLAEWITEKYMDKFQVKVIQGATDPILREGIRQNMENEKGVVLVATYGTLSTGINIKRIHHIVFGSSSKSHIRVLQSIGRGLRLHETKDKLVLWDVVDDLSHVSKTGRTTRLNYMMKHWNERYKIYQDQGFECLKKTLKIEQESQTIEFLSNIGED